jgi:hypothetical protein
VQGAVGASRRRRQRVCLRVRDDKQTAVIKALPHKTLDSNTLKRELNTHRRLCATCAGGRARIHARLCLSWRGERPPLSRPTQELAPHSPRRPRPTHTSPTHPSLAPSSHPLPRSMSSNKIARVAGKPCKACAFCKKEGHEFARCPTLAANKCPYCKAVGHTIKHCPEMKCGRCKKVGHTFKHCPQHLCTCCNVKGHLWQQCPWAAPHLAPTTSFCLEVKDRQPASK